MAIVPMSVYVCEIENGAVSTKVDVPPMHDFVLVVGKKSYVFKIDRDGDIVLSLNDGREFTIMAFSNQPAIKLIGKSNRTSSR